MTFLNVWREFHLSTSFSSADNLTLVPHPYPMKTSLLLVSILCSASLAHAAEIPSREWQIETAVLAASPDQRADATVLGYDSNGAIVTLRKGSNNFICLADNPKQKGFSVASYHKDLEPFMARGRELTEQGKDGGEIFKIREEEVKSGKLPLPDKSILNVATGTVNEATGDVTDLYTRFVIYIPFATPESTGIPLTPAVDGAPWIMNPGTHRAHIMINPPKAAAPHSAKDGPAGADHRNHN